MVPMNVKLLYRRILQSNFAGNNMTRWRNRMETISALLALYAENSPTTGELPSPTPVMRSFGILFELRLNCAWTNDWVNNQNVGDLRHHRAHYSITVMSGTCTIILSMGHGKCNPWQLFALCRVFMARYCPDSKVHGANMGPTWVLSAPDGPRVGPMNLPIRVVNVIISFRLQWQWCNP